MRWPFTTWPIWRPRRLEAAAIRARMITAEAATAYVRAADLAADQSLREQGEPMADDLAQPAPEQATADEGVTMGRDLATELKELREAVADIAYSEKVLARAVKRMAEKDTAGPELAEEQERLRLFYQRKSIIQKWMLDPLYQPPGRDWIGKIVD
jgi:hypothetical protein